MSFSQRVERLLVRGAGEDLLVLRVEHPRAAMPHVQLNPPVVDHDAVSPELTALRAMVLGGLEFLRALAFETAEFTRALPLVLALGACLLLRLLRDLLLLFAAQRGRHQGFVAAAVRSAKLVCAAVDVGLTSEVTPRDPWTCDCARLPWER